MNRRRLKTPFAPHAASSRCFPSLCAATPQIIAARVFRALWRPAVGIGWYSPPDRLSPLAPSGGGFSLLFLSVSLPFFLSFTVNLCPGGKGRAVAPARY